MLFLVILLALLAGSTAIALIHYILDRVMDYADERNVPDPLAGLLFIWAAIILFGAFFGAAVTLIQWISA